VAKLLESLTYSDFHWPGLVALRQLGGSATNQEMNAQVIEGMGFTEEDQSVLQNDGPMTAIEYRLHWARTYLKGMGLAKNSGRGVWELTEAGRHVTEDQLPALRKRYVDKNRKKREAAKTGVLPKARLLSSDEDPDESLSSELSWKDQLLEEILNLSPQAFEELARWLLREEGFVEAEVVGGRDDQGIDVQGYYRISLLSFQVFVQCKRYRNAVGPSVVRDFRGAMQGRGDKGLLMTTASFTTAAQKEARRPGAPPIDLIDGGALCDLLKKHRKGVKVTERIEEDIEVVPAQLQSL
jgi:restriction system protein